MEQELVTNLKPNEFLLTNIHRKFNSFVFFSNLTINQNITPTCVMKYTNQKNKLTHIKVTLEEENCEKKIAFLKAYLSRGIDNHVIVPKMLTKEDWANEVVQNRTVVVSGIKESEDFSGLVEKIYSLSGVLGLEVASEYSNPILPSTQKAISEIRKTYKDTDMEAKQFKILEREGEKLNEILLDKDLEIESMDTINNKEYLSASLLGQKVTYNLENRPEVFKPADKSDRINTYLFENVVFNTSKYNQYPIF